MKFVKEASAEVAEAAVQNDATSKLKSKKLKDTVHLVQSCQQS